MADRQPDFSGWATRAGLECSDGRTILEGAFEHQDGEQVPLVWAHSHDEPTNVLGHAVLEKRKEGVYAYGFFNNSPAAQHVKEAVQHGDLNALSIFANKLKERGKNVMHGFIKELSLVIAGANPGAFIENVAFAHGDGVIEMPDEVIIFTGLELEHGAMDEDSESDEADEADELEHAEGDEETVADIYNSFDPKQKEVVHFMIGAALEQAAGSVKHSDDESTASEDTASEETDESTEETQADAETSQETTSTDTSTEGTPPEGDQQTDNNEGNLAHQEGSSTMTNAFERGATGTATIDRSKALTHEQLIGLVKAAKESNGHFKEAVLAHAETYGINDINLLFPDAKALETSPQFIQRRTEWVASVLDGVKHSPFAKVKTILADITADEARAKGYITGRRKSEEVFGLLRRTTGPTTIYKKQKLDRDDILDITDIDVINWLKAEMRLMIEEELARCILVGDGRSALSDDKVKDPAGANDGNGIRSILHDDALYSVKRELAANVSPKDAVKGLVRARAKYRGTGKPTLFVSDNMLTDIMLEEDKFARPLYETEQVLADKLRVKSIVTVDLFDEHPTLMAIMVSLQDYTIGTNRGGELTSFEDFDIDFNQHKYLQETRLSGGLTKPFSAVVVTRQQGTLVSATQPTFDPVTDTISIPTVTGVSYYNADTDTEMTGDVVITAPTEVEARADAGYYTESNTTNSWSYTP